MIKLSYCADGGELNTRGKNEALFMWEECCNCKRSNIPTYQRTHIISLVLSRRVQAHQPTADKARAREEQEVHSCLFGVNAAYMVCIGVSFVCLHC